jgi:hypothetical protein
MEALSPSKPKPQLLALHPNLSTGASWVLLGHVSTKGKSSKLSKKKHAYPAEDARWQAAAV